MKLVSMATTPAERKEANAEIAPEKDNGPIYPWGLSISLNDDVLDKLGLKLPEVGDTMMITAKVRVTSASAREYEYDGAKKTCRDCSLQITDLGVQDQGEADAADRLYDGGSAE